MRSCLAADRMQRLHCYTLSEKISLYMFASVKRYHFDLIAVTKAEFKLVHPEDTPLCIIEVKAIPC